MNGPNQLPRSPQLMSRDTTALLVVDMQTRLLSVMNDARRLIWNVSRLIDGARMLGLPMLATEQYPTGLGPTTPELTDRIGEIPSKTMFSCRGCPEFAALLGARR